MKRPIHHSTILERRHARQRTKHAKTHNRPIAQIHADIGKPYRLRDDLDDLLMFGLGIGLDWVGGVVIHVSPFICLVGRCLGVSNLISDEITRPNLCLFVHYHDNCRHSGQALVS